MDRGDPCWCRGELSIDEILADPIIGMMMAADGVDRDELAAVLHQTRDAILRNAAGVRG